MSLDEKMHYCEDVSILQIDLLVQCNCNDNHNFWGIENTINFIFKLEKKSKANTNLKRKHVMWTLILSASSFLMSC